MCDIRNIFLFVLFFFIWFHLYFSASVLYILYKDKSCFFLLNWNGACNHHNMWRRNMLRFIWYLGFRTFKSTKNMLGLFICNNCLFCCPILIWIASLAYQTFETFVPIFLSVDYVNKVLQKYILSISCFVRLFEYFLLSLFRSFIFQLKSSIVSCYVTYSL